MKKIKNKNIIMVAVILVIAFTVVFVNTKLQKGTFFFQKPKVFRLIDVSPRLPDLIIQSIEVGPSANGSNWVHITVTVKNQGNGRVPASDIPVVVGSLGIYAGREPAVYLFSRVIRALDVSETQTFSTDFGKDRYRNYLDVEVDDTHSVRESEEANNWDGVMVPTR